MRPWNWSIRPLIVFMGGMLAACGSQQPPVGGVSHSAIPPAGDLAQPLSTFSGETFSAKKVNSNCDIFYVGFSDYVLTLTYYVAGKASGPYPGTFIAKGRVEEELSPSYSYYFREKYKVTSHRRQIVGFAKSRSEFFATCVGAYAHITRARYSAVHSSGRTDVIINTHSFSESFG